ncbi:hypothetical protein [Mucilaginibacter agri]|uniref:Uncharacterized protein n=1 Tax=Mucilaginibacter agri TaxID=2695265 RepID=A0A966DSR0_9SPHI|nr:hypothetical protein [Mucilaginibacter agri]NCD68576.1 hypothetical protein [Mucilaginibacter agri]
MRTSNKLIVGLGAILVVATITVDLMLKSIYNRIDLLDPLKNYDAIPATEFRVLRFIGGNAYAVSIQPAPSTGIKVMRSRKGFLRTEHHGDTLFVRFSVMSNGQMRDPEQVPLGLIISTPHLDAVFATGGDLILRGWKNGNLKLDLFGNGSADLSGLQLTVLTILAHENALVRLRRTNSADSLVVRSEQKAQVILEDIRAKKITPVLLDQSHLVLNKASVKAFFLRD